MNSLSLGFFYVCGLAWCLIECCIRAVAGDPLPAILFLVAFAVIFSILGCMKVSDKVVNLVGTVTAFGLAVSLFLFSLQADGFVMGLKLFFAIAFVLGAAVMVLPGGKTATEGGH